MRDRRRRLALVRGRHLREDRGARAAAPGRTRLAGRRRVEGSSIVVARKETLTAGWVLPMATPPLRDGRVAIEGGRVVWVGRGGGPRQPHAPLPPLPPS